MNKPKELSASDLEEIRILSESVGSKPTEEIEKLWDKWRTFTVTLMLLDHIAYQAARISELEAGLMDLRQLKMCLCDGNQCDECDTKEGVLTRVDKLLSPRTQG